MSIETPTRFSDRPQIDTIDRFTSESLPDLNDHIEAGLWPVDFLYRDWDVISRQLGQISPLHDFDEITARHLLGRLAFIVGSAERHHQSRGLPKGSGLASLPNMESMLLELAIPAHHIPRDSFETYWLWNRGPTHRARFTGDAQEFVFADAVIATHDIQTRNASAIRPICLGQLSLDHVDAMEALEIATSGTSTLCKIYQGLRPPKFQPKYFTERMRTYLVDFPVGGTLYSAVNAADLPAQICIDYLLGFPNDDYYPQVVRRRMAQMTPEAQLAVDRDVATVPLLAVIAASLGTTIQQIASSDITELHRAVVDSSWQLRKSFLKAGELYREQQRLTGIHWALIKQFLINYTKNMSAEKKAALPVNPDEGTGHTGHERTHDIMLMRMKHTLATKIVKVTTTIMMENEDVKIRV